MTDFPQLIIAYQLLSTVISVASPLFLYGFPAPWPDRKVRCVNSNIPLVASICMAIDHMIVLRRLDMAIRLLRRRCLESL